MEGLLRLLGMQLRTARKQAGMTRREVSTICGEAKETIKKIERGDWEPKGWHELNAIANIGIAIQIRLDEEAKDDAVCVREEAEDKGDFNYNVSISEATPAPAPEVSSASSTGEYVRRLREREGISVRQLAESSGLDAFHIEHLERITVWDTSIQTLDHLRRVGSCLFLAKMSRIRQAADAAEFKEAFG